MVIKVGRIFKSKGVSNFDFELSSEDMEAIKSLDTGRTTIFDHHDPDKVKFLSGYRFNI